jgi:hypothetical protein
MESLKNIKETYKRDNTCQRIEMSIYTENPEIDLRDNAK